MQMDQMEATFSHVPSYKEIDSFYSLINRDPDFLHVIDKKKFVDTPLHFAAGEGRTQLALEIQRLMPSFGMKLNADGFSPLHLALQRGHTDTVRAMVRLNPELVGVQGREGITPLHYAAETDAVDLLADFLLLWPDSIQNLTVREETAAHVAVKNRKLAAVKVLVGWMKWKGRRRVVFTWKDLEGNTVLHLAASTNQPEVLKVLLTVVFRDVNEKNSRGLTALDIVMQLPRHEDNGRALSILRHRRAKTGSSIAETRLSEYLMRSNMPLTEVIGEYLDNRLSTEMRSAALVVAGLIVTTTYQGMLKPPSIVSSQNPVTLNITTSRADNSSAFNLLQAPPALNLSRVELIERKVIFAAEFMLPNSIALAASMGTILLMLPFQIQNLLLHLSLVSLMLSTFVILGSIGWLQPDSRVGANIGLFVFLLIFMMLLLIKATTTEAGVRMRKRLMVRGHRVMFD